MTLIVTRGIPIPTEFFVPDTFQKILPPPQIDIGRIRQSEDAWCYAACAEMVINYCRPKANVTQCKIASYVKTDECCEPPPRPAICTLSGCRKDQIDKIFNKWEVHSQPLATFLNPEDVEIEIKAKRLIEVVIDWQGKQSSHAVLISGISGDWVFILDPLEDAPYWGWRLHADLREGFGNGTWSDTWIGLRKR